MFGFLRDSWAPHDHDSSDDEGARPEQECRQDKAYTSATSVVGDIDVAEYSEKNASTIETDSATRIRQLELQNAQMLNQLSSLQGIITAKSSLYLEYKAKYEASELERVKNAQQSTEALISMQTEVAKLEAEVLRLQESKNVASSAFDIELFKENLEAEKQQEISAFHRQLTDARAALLESQSRISELESELARVDLTARAVDGSTDARGGMGEPEERDIEPFCAESLDRSAARHRRRRLPASLLETRIMEARHMQWASAVHLRESAVMIRQCEKVGAVMAQLEGQSHTPGVKGVAMQAQTDHLQSRLTPLRKSAADLEQSFESSRKLAVVLDSRLESARHNMYAEVLSAVEPEIDSLDAIFNTLEPALLQTISTTVSAINKSIRYRPGESRLRQEQSADRLGGSQSPEYLFSMREECKSLIPVLSEFMETAAMKCDGLVAASVPVIKPLEDAMDDCFLQHGGDYSYVCDMLSCTMVADSLEVVRELLGVIGTNDGERKRVNLPGSLAFSSPSAARFPRYALIAVKNKFNQNYDAVSFAAGYRDLCMYMRFVESPHPLHIVELRVDLRDYVEAAGGIQGGWVTHLFRISRPLKIFDDPLRTHLGPVDKNSLVDIKEGVTCAINMDHFPFSLSGGDYLISALSQSPYCAVQEVSLHGCGLSDNELSMLLAVLTIHKRLKVFRASGERDDIRGQIRHFPWDVFEREAHYANKPQVSSGQACQGFANLQKLDMAYNSISGNIYPFISSILPGLKVLNFDDNCLTGHIPPDLGNMSNLQYIVLSRNELTGPIPASIGNLIHLKDFQVWQNKLSGPIPHTFGNLTNLLRMNIDSCMLSGSIPEELGNLTALRELYCFDNRLNGELSPKLCGMINLQYLGLNGNQLTGSIPPEFGRMRKLRTLFLHENSLVGSIPHEICGLIDLKKLSFRGNRLIGDIPSSIGSLSSLQALALSENQLSGSIPSEITRLEFLEALSLANNRLMGPLPSGLSRMTSLRSLDITKNQISGKFPIELCSMARLHDLLMGDNCIEGAIPHEIGKLDQLCNLELAGNKLRGSIPTIEIARMKSLRSLDISRNYLMHADAAQKHLEERLRGCFVNIDSGQRPKAQDD